MRTIALVTINIFLLCGFFHKVSCAAKPNSAVSAPLPRSKNAKGGLAKGMGHGFFGRIVREIKGNFCSELESIALQVFKYHIVYIFS